MSGSSRQIHKSPRTVWLPPSPLKLPPKSLTTTLAPLLPKKREYARPRPPPAPVTTTVWPSHLSCSPPILRICDRGKIEEWRRVWRDWGKKKGVWSLEPALHLSDDTLGRRRQKSHAEVKQCDHIHAVMWLSADCHSRSRRIQLIMVF